MLGNGVVVDDIESTDEAVFARLGLERPEIIQSHSPQRQVLSFLHLRNVDALRFQRGAELKAKYLDSDAFFVRAEDRRKTLISQAQQALVEAAKNRIVKVQPLGSSLTPIREIIIYIHEENSLSLRRLRNGKRERYVPMLEALGFVQIKDETLYAGPELQKFNHATLKLDNDVQFYDAVLGDVLSKGYRELQDGLHIGHLKPIVRAANAYYFASNQVERPLEFAAEDFVVQLRRLHPHYRQDSLKLRNHLLELAAHGVLEKNGSTFTAVDDIWTRYRAFVSQAQLAA